MIDQRVHSPSSSPPSSRPLRLPPPPAPPPRPISMLAFENPQSRPLSPITELTTPGSFRTIALPLVEPVHPDEYESEHEQRLDDAEDGDGGSTYSRDSGDTVTHAHDHDHGHDHTPVPSLEDQTLQQELQPRPPFLGAPIQAEPLSPLQSQGHPQTQIPFPAAPTYSELQPTKSIKRIPPPSIHPIDNLPPPINHLIDNPPVEVALMSRGLILGSLTPPPTAPIPIPIPVHSDFRPARFERPASSIVAGATSPFDIASAEIRRRANERARPATIHGHSPSMTPLGGNYSNLTDLKDGDGGMGEPPRMVPDEGYGIAGVGAGGRSRPNSIRSRPSSFHAQRPDLTSPSLAELAAEESLNNSLPSLDISPRPAFISQHSHPTLHKIPMLPFDPTPESSPKKGNSNLPTKTPPRSRPSSLLKRPNSYHGSRPGSVKSRPNSFHALEGSGGYERFEPAVVPVSAVGQGDGEMSMAGTAAGTKPIEPKETSPPSTLRAHLSDTSLPLPSSPHPKSHRRTPPRRRIVSSIFSTLFGSSTPDLTSSSSTANPPETSRRLSKRRIRTTSLGFTSRSSSPKDQTRNLSNNDNNDALLPPLKPITATRSSGTFGIPDDGSDLYQVPSRVSKWADSPAEVVAPDIFRARTESGTGSVVSEGLKRVLYVKNGGVDESAFGDDERRHVDEGVVDPAVRRVTVESGEEALVRGGNTNGGGPRLSGGYLLKPVGNEGSVIMVERASLDGVERPFTLSPPATRSPMSFAKSNSRSPTPPLERILYPASIDFGVVNTINVTSHVSLEKPTRSEQNHNTEASPSPKRPLPRPPSASRPNSTLNPSSSQSYDSHSYDSHATHPHLNIPAPPSREPSSGFTPTKPPDISLLIASHLLSTQAANLFQHSSSMKDVSETICKMARESLDWENHLLGVAREGGGWEGIPNSGLGVGGIGGVQFPVVGYGEVDDVDARATRDTTPKAGSIPLKGDNFTPIPQRLSSKRTRSISTLNLHSQTRQKGLSDSTHENRAVQQVSVRDAGIWLFEVERLGREGWNSLHQAEAAWLCAMRNLREMSSRQIEADHTREGNRVVSNKSGTVHSAVGAGGSSATAYSPGQPIDGGNDIQRDPKRMIISRHQSLEHLSSMVNYQTSTLPDSTSPISPGLQTPMMLDKGYSNQHLGFDSLAAIANGGRPISRVSAGGAGKKLSKRQPTGGLVLPVRLERVPTREKDAEIGVGVGVKGGSMRSGSVKRRWWGGRRVQA